MMVMVGMPAVTVIVVIMIVVIMIAVLVIVVIVVGRVRWVHGSVRLARDSSTHRFAAFCDCCSI